MPENPRRRHRAHRRWEDCRIWREFFCACIPLIPYSIPEAAKLADQAYAEYRERFPVASTDPADELAALDPESDEQDSTVQPKKVQ